MTHQNTDVDSPYHGITKPAFEKDHWDHDYYDFVDDVDSNLKLSGTVANRPSAANAPDNAWYEATDENIVYRNDSTNGWTKVASKNHNDLDSISSDDHHSKTSSASELSDVSPDSVSDAHHGKTTSSEIDHDSTIGGTSGNPHGDSASNTDVSNAVENHRTGQTHTTDQPPETHDNTDHTETYTTTAEDVENFSTSGASGTVPTSQGDGTISMEGIDATTELDLLHLMPGESPPLPSNITTPTVAYYEDEDDYIGIFQA